MKVILLDNIKGIGQVGDIKQVSDGYARNFLLPRLLARPATAGSIKDIEAVKVKKLAELGVVTENAKKVAEQLKDVTLEFTAKASEKGTLFASIEAQDIAEELKKTARVSLQISDIKIQEPIKSVGEHSVTLELPGDVSVPMKINVSARKKD